nr:unnamed protein product [Callosobruchus chinensis]
MAQSVPLKSRLHQNIM